MLKAYPTVARTAIALCIGVMLSATSHAQTLPSAPPSPLSLSKNLKSQLPDSLKGVGLAEAGAFDAQPAPVSIKGSSTLSADRKASPASARAAAQPQEPTEFQRMVLQTVGRALPVFGDTLFVNSTANNALASVPALADYIVGPGDELVIKAWGGIEIEYRATVDTDGSFYLPKVGNVFVAGTKFAELQKTIQTAVRKSYKNFELSVSMGQVRAVEVMVVGQAVSPGTFQLSPYATVMTALAAANGPSARGSMRAVNVKRAGKTVATLDLYKLMLQGDRSQDVRLMPGDVVVVANAGAQVAVDGAIGTQAIFEMKDGESLQDLVGFAGGFAVSAKTDAVLVERVARETFKRQVVEVSAAQGVPATSLQGGDIVRVPRITNEYANAVTLRGAVAAPGRLAFKDGARVSDVITSRDMLIESSYWANRNAAAGQAVNSEDALASGVKKSFEEINWDYAVIERLDRNTLQTQLIPFNLGKALAKDASQDVELRAGDTLTIFSKDDVKVPLAKQARLVRVQGEVNSPGVYRAEPEDTLQTLVQKAGGLTPQAYLYGTELRRESVRKDQQRRMQETVERLQTALEREARTRASDAMTSEEAKLDRVELEGQKDAITKLKSAPANGRVVLELKPGSRAVKDIPALPLENDDTLTIPAQSSTVSVAGSVFNENSFIYAKDKSVDDYVRQAGGPVAPNASNLVYVSRADGTVTRASGSERLNPGDAVIVVEEVGRKSILRSLRDWTQVFYQFGLGAVALKAFK